MPNWTELLRTGVSRGASDIFLSAGSAPTVRVNGALERLDGQDELPASQARDMLVSLLQREPHEVVNGIQDLDLAYQHHEIGRFRVNIFQHLRGFGAVFRVIPSVPPRLSELVGEGQLALSTLPSLAEHSHGLVLFVGSTGSGKSSTQAAVVDLLNRQGRRHIICVEDPIEFVHASTEGLVHQRQVGTHVASFADALRAALRENPDVIVIGELRDASSIQLALTAAETGHLVLGTCHASSAIHCVTRLLEGLPEAHRSQARGVLAASLVSVVYQRLILGSANRRIAAFEILKATPAVRHLIRESKPAQLHSVMQTGRQQGMQTMEQALQELTDIGVLAAPQRPEPLPS